MIWWGRAKSALRLFFMETSYVARVYGDSLRDNFVGYAPLDQVKFDKLEDQFREEMKGDHPYLANLLRIEAALIETMPDNVMQERFWAIEDRFQRVVPLATRTRYEASVPPRGDLMWKNAAFMRDQQRARAAGRRPCQLSDQYRAREIDKAFEDPSSFVSTAPGSWHSP